MTSINDAKAFLFIVGLLGVAGCSSATFSSGSPVSPASLQSESSLGLSVAAAPSNATCERRVNNTTAKLLQCIQEAPLFQHLVDLQRISDENPGSDGHGNRDTGQPGYKASVDYVAALMRKAGYRVTVQQYNYKHFSVTGAPVFRTLDHAYSAGQDWFVARLSGSGTLTAHVQPVGEIDANTTEKSGAGCSAGDFAGFAAGNIALIQRGGCALDTKVANAQAARAAGAIIFNVGDASELDTFDRVNTKGGSQPAEAFAARLTTEARIPVLAVASYALGSELYREYSAGHAPIAHLDVETHTDASAIDYNLIADSPFGNSNRVVVVDAHLDAIYGAGILDNGSGSSTILEVALKMAKTPTRNQLRYIWFGGEEINLLGSAYYTKNLTPRSAAKSHSISTPMSRPRRTIRCWSRRRNSRAMSSAFRPT